MAEQIRAAAASDQPPPLRLSRVFHAPRASVFKAWSTAEHIKRWFSPQTYSTPDARVELRAGGAFDVCMRSPGGEEHWTRATFTEVVPDERLVFEGHATDPSGRPVFTMVTEVSFLDVLGGTQMDVVQTYAFVDPDVAAAMVSGAPEGWRTTLDKLDALVMSMRSGGEATRRSVAHGTFHLQRTYEVPVARLWSALTEPAAKARWFAGTPGRWELIERRMDVRPGGRERLEGRWESGLVSTFEAIYHDVVPGERLIYSYEMYMDRRKISVSMATMQLKADGPRTTLFITEQGAFLDGYDDAGSREQGTRSLLDAIGASLTD
jgi:uncharacterized protein YndB with AHSA1/START domain